MVLADSKRNFEGYEMRELDIWSEDPNEEKQTITFEPVDGGDAITEAMRFAERYDAARSKS